VSPALGCGSKRCSASSIAISPSALSAVKFLSHVSSLRSQVSPIPEGGMLQHVPSLRSQGTDHDPGGDLIPEEAVMPLRLVVDCAWDGGAGALCAPSPPTYSLTGISRIRLSLFSRVRVGLCRPTPLQRRQRRSDAGARQPGWSHGESDTER
jgi:hypothetical protein